MSKITFLKHKTSTDTLYYLYLDGMKQKQYFIEEINYEIDSEQIDNIEYYVSNTRPVGESGYCENLSKAKQLCVERFNKDKIMSKISI